MNQNEAKALYNKLIEEARKIEPKGLKPKGYEIHHIIPRSCGGTNDNNNKITLSYKLHFEAHKLLKDMYPNGSNEFYRMSHAFWMMCNTRDGKKTATPEEYYQARMAHAERTRELMKGRECKEETRKKIGAASKIHQKKRFSDPEQRRLTSITTKEGMNNPEVKEKLRKHTLGKKQSQETILKRTMANTGKTRSEEIKLKMSIAQLKLHKRVSEETRLKLSAASSIKVGQYNKETKELISVYSSISEAQKQLGIRNKKAIGEACRNILETAGGFIWKYIKD